MLFGKDEGCEAPPAIRTCARPPTPAIGGRTSLGGGRRVTVSCHGSARAGPKSRNLLCVEASTFRGHRSDEAGGAGRSASSGEPSNGSSAPRTLSSPMSRPTPTARSGIQSTSGYARSSAPLALTAAARVNAERADDCGARVTKIGATRARAKRAPEYPSYAPIVRRSWGGAADRAVSAAQALLRSRPKRRCQRPRSSAAPRSPPASRPRRAAARPGR